MAMYELSQGMKVMSSDGKSLGKIIRVEGTSFLVEKGFLFPKDYEIPRSLVADVRADVCWLSASGDALQGDIDAARLQETGAGMPQGASTSQDTSARAGDASRMSLSEEELEARKRVHDAGEVSVRKEVVTEHRQIDVPVTKEEVHVERGPATSASAPAGEPFREETIRVPVREEEVEVTKRPRVREEVRVTKEARQEEQRVEGDVRREEARIDRTDEEGGAGREEP